MFVLFVFDVCLYTAFELPTKQSVFKRLLVQFFKFNVPLFVSHCHYSLFFKPSYFSNSSRVHSLELFSFATTKVITDR